MSETILLTSHPIRIAVQSHILHYSPEGVLPSLRILAKRFSLTEVSKPPIASQSDQYTLIVTTGIGAGTETWIPTIVRLFEMQSELDSPVKIREIWSIDSPNQGESAVLNDRVLIESYADLFEMSYYSQAVYKVITSGLIDLRGSKVVGIGHSVGCGALIHGVPETDPIPFHLLIMVDIGLMHRSVGDILRMISKQSIPRIMTRKDVWPTKEDAIAWMIAHHPRKSWHPEVMQAIKDYGLRTLPTAGHPNETGVTTTIYKGQEAASFRCIEGNFDSVDKISRFCSSIPVHTIWGERKDFLPKKIQNILTDPAQGRSMVSISEIPDAGHWVLQEKPDELSRAIFEILKKPHHSTKL